MLSAVKSKWTLSNECDLFQQPEYPNCSLCLSASQSHLRPRVTRRGQKEIIKRGKNKRMSKIQRFLDDIMFCLWMDIYCVRDKIICAAFNSFGTKRKSVLLWHISNGTEYEEAKSTLIQLHSRLSLWRSVLRDSFSAQPSGRVWEERAEHGSLSLPSRSIPTTTHAILSLSLSLSLLTWTYGYMNINRKLVLLITNSVENAQKNRDCCNELLLRWCNSGKFL